MSSAPAPGIKQLIASVLAAALGVQSARGRQRDFAAAHPLPYVLAGILFVALFVASLVLLVRVITA